MSLSLRTGAVWALATALWGGLSLWALLSLFVTSADSLRRGDEPTRSAWIWDSQSNQLRTAPRLAIARTKPVALALEDGTVLIAGGETGKARARVPVAVAERWRPEGPSEPIGELLRYRGGVVSVQKATQPSNGAVAELTAGPLAALWTRQAPKGHALGVSALMADHRVLLVEGGRAEIWSPETSEMEDAPPPAGSGGHWTALFSLPTGRMLLVGQHDQATRFLSWRPGEVAWQEGAAWPGFDGSFERAAQLDDGRVLVIRHKGGGENEATLFDPETRALTPAAPPLSTVYGSSLTAAGAGLVLHMGSPAPEVWNPRENVWKQPQGGAHPASDHVAVRLGDRVLIAGGTTNETHLDPHDAAFAAGALAALIGLLGGALWAVRKWRPSRALLSVSVLGAAAGVAVCLLFALSLLAVVTRD